MKTIILLFITFFSLISCSKKVGVKENFKLIIGKSALSVPMLGGAYVETEDKATNIKTIIKLDAEYSAMIPNGSYNLLFVTFTGPAVHGGLMYCGKVSNANFSASGESLDVTITKEACTELLYSELIAKIIGNIGSTGQNWDSAKFDQAVWGL